MPDFAHPMISRTYDQGAKPFVSPCEMNPSAFAWFVPPPEAPSIFAALRFASRRESRGGRARLYESGQAEDDPKWRRKRLKRLDSGAEMAPPARCRLAREWIVPLARSRRR
jgi:hypothetical protein